MAFNRCIDPETGVVPATALHGPGQSWTLLGHLAEIVTIDVIGRKTILGQIGV